MIMYNQITFKTAGNVSRSGHPKYYTPRSDSSMFRETARSYELRLMHRASDSKSNVNNDESTVKITYKYIFRERVPKQILV